MHYLTLTLHYLSVHRVALLSLVGGGAGLSVLLEVLLTKLKVDSKKVAYTLLHLFSILTAVSAYYLDNKGVLPAYAGLVIAAQTWHRFAVSPAFDKYVVPFLNWLSDQKAPVQAKTVSTTETAASPEVTTFA
jgi:hypothetical protein